MSALVIALRIVSLLAFAAPALLRAGARPDPGSGGNGGGRAPVLANLAAFGLFFLALAIFAGGADTPMAPPLALAGCLIALAGAALVLRSRAALGPAWSFVAKADREAGLVTTGPYRLVRHPIYLGLALIALGAALAFFCWPALAIVLAGIVPTFAWRAQVEEQRLSRAFGERYASYVRRTRAIIPYLL
jgi:protein-S-isoprenylcysteine O-methyltransferase Ste14